MRKQQVIILSLMMALSIGMAGCTSAPPMTLAQPDLTFEQLAPVSLAVSKIEIYDQYKSPMTGRNIEHEFSTTPAAAARRLIEKKLAATGTRQILRVYIDDASVVRDNLPVAKDFWGEFSREPSEKMLARVALRFELVNEEAPDIVVGRASVVSDRTRSLLENTSLADRDRAYLNLTEELMSDLYAGFKTVVRDTFGAPR